MPEWTDNTIRATGAEADIKELIRTTSGGPERPFDFNTITPMPDLLRHTARGSDIFDDEWHSSWHVSDPGHSHGRPQRNNDCRPFTPEERLRLDKIGYYNWCDWCEAHWGTTSNACEASAWVPVPGEVNVVEIYFETVWHAPMPIFHKLAAKFPRISFDISWEFRAEGISGSLRRPATEGMPPGGTRRGE